MQSWKKKVEISSSLIDGLPDDEVLKLALSKVYFYREEPKSGATVQDVLEETVNEARDKYLPAMQAQGANSNDNFHCWALVRVGLARVVWQKVVPLVDLSSSPSS